MTPKRSKKDKPHFSVRAGKRLAAWARKLAAGALTPAEEEQMERLVHKYLNSSRDEVFDQAFAELQGDREAVLELEEFLEFESELVAAAIKTTDGGMEPGYILMFAVPMAIAIMPGMSAPASLQGEKFDHVTKSFRRHGLISRDASLVLLSGLYPLESLDIPYSRRRVAISRMLGHLSGKPTKEPFPPPPPPEQVSAPLVALRFLVGMAVFGDLEKEPFSDLPEERLDEWREEVSNMLSSEPDIMALAGTPAPFGQALRDGLDLFRTMALELTVETAAERAAEMGQPCLAEMEESLGEPEIRFRFLDGEGRLLEDYTFPILDHDSPEEWTSVWIDVFSRFGVKLLPAREKPMLH